MNAHTGNMAVRPEDNAERRKPATESAHATAHVCECMTRGERAGARGHLGRRGKHRLAGTHREEPCWFWARSARVFQRRGSSPRLSLQRAPSSRAVGAAAGRTGFPVGKGSY